MHLQLNKIIYYLFIVVTVLSTSSRYPLKKSSAADEDSSAQIIFPVIPPMVSGAVESGDKSSSNFTDIELLAGAAVTFAYNANVLLSPA